jgi:hypothetical protein
MRREPFKVVEVNGKMIGGHHAVEDDHGRIIGADWKLDRFCASGLCLELNRAFERGVMLGERVSG